MNSILWDFSGGTLIFVGVLGTGWYFTVYFREFFTTLTLNWSWQGEEPVPGALYSIMLSQVARKEPEVRRQGTWRDFTLTFERWKKWLRISEGLVALPSVFQKGDGFSLKERAEMSWECSCTAEVLVLDPCATGSILCHAALPTPRCKSQNMQLTGLFGWRTTKVKH